MSKVKAPTREALLRADLMAAGIEPNERQLAWALLFCDTEGVCFQDSVKAARCVGYPNPEDASTELFKDMGHVLLAFVDEQKLMARFAVKELVRHCHAKTTKILSHQGLVLDMIELEDNATQLSAASKLADIYQPKVPAKTELTIDDPADRLTRAEERANAVLLGLDDGQ